jgi:hypothetical protein
MNKNMHKLKEILVKTQNNRSDNCIKQVNNRGINNFWNIISKVYLKS